MAILLLINLKGGVAKTTSAVAVAECLASAGHRTLLIDADHQCMAGELMLGESRQDAIERRRRTLHDLLATMLDDDFSPEAFPSFVTNRVSDIRGGLERLSVLPCSVRMDDFSTNMAKAKRGYRSNEEFLRMFERRRMQMRRWLKQTYDFTVVDCPPSLALQVKALVPVADGYIVPSVPDRLSVRGSLFLMDRLRNHGYKIAAVGTLWSLYRVQNDMHRKVVERTAAGASPFGRLPRPFETIIPNAAKIAEATEPGQQPASFRHKYSPPFAKLFEALCEEIIQRAEWEPAREQPAVPANA